MELVDRSRWSGSCECSSQVWGKVFVPQLLLFTSSSFPSRLIISFRVFLRSSRLTGLSPRECQGEAWFSLILTSLKCISARAYGGWLPCFRDLILLSLSLSPLEINGESLIFLLTSFPPPIFAYFLHLCSPFSPFFGVLDRELELSTGHL